MYDEDAAGINSELRYITLELMKLSKKRKASFSEVADEFIANVCSLDELIRKKAVKGARLKSRKKHGAGFGKRF